MFGQSHLEDLVVITGFSGAGKSTAMNVFEDAGYFCVDNLPPEMIRSLVELFMHEGSKVERAAVVSDVRGGEYFEALRAVLDDLDALGVTHRVLFLDADEETLLTRYKETRRRHPLAPESSVTGGIDLERAMLEPLRERADLVIDTTGLKAHMLRRKIADEFLPRDRPAAAGGHVPVLRLQARPAARRRPDVRRALPAQPALRARPAPADRPRPARGRRTWTARAGSTEFYEHLEPLLDFLLPQYVAEGKAHLMVAIGCTGGRHRCVAIAEHLAERYAARDDLFVEVGTATSTRRTPSPACSTTSGFEVSDLERSARFYDALMFAIGGRRMFEGPGAIAYGIDGAQLWIVARGRGPGADSRRSATSRSRPPAGRRSTPPTRRRSPTAAATRARPARARSTGRATTPPTCRPGRATASRW